MAFLLPTAAAAEDAGWLAYLAGHPDDAVRVWQAEAGAGDKDASFGLGVAYDLGQGVAPDARLACRFYTEAAERGHMAAAFNTAVMHDSGRCGNGRQADLAALWYGRAAAAGMGRAQFNLAQLYAAGDGVPRNPAVAAAWYRAAAANGIPAAANRGGGARHTGGQGPLLPVVPVFPNPAQPVSSAEGATLVWTAPDEPEPAQFFLEIYALTPSGPVEVGGQFLDVTATHVSLPPDATRFTWRVLTVSTDPPRYAVGPWCDFEAAPATSKP